MRSYRIGRADTNDIVLDEATVSREHATLTELGGGRFSIQDLRIGKYQTTVGDLLQATDRTVVNARPAAPARPQPPAPPQPSAPPNTPAPAQHVAPPTPPQPPAMSEPSAAPAPVAVSEPSSER